MTHIPEPVAKEKVEQWFPMAEGHGDTVGYSGGENNGCTWVAGDYIGGYALKGDGDTDYIETTNWGEFGEMRGSGWTICFTLETNDSTGRTGISDDNHEGLQMGTATIGNSEAGRWVIWMRDQNGNTLEFETETYVDDGERRRYAISVGSSHGKDASIWLNGRDEPLIVNRDQNPSNFIQFWESFSILAMWRNGVGHELGGIIDDFIVYGDTLTESEIQADYMRQPWS